MKRALVILGLASLLIAGPAAAITVQTELLMLVDVSGSVSTPEFNLQKTGYVNAFQGAAVQAKIAQASGGIAAALVYWSSAGNQVFAASWTHLTDAASCNAFGATINGFARPFGGATAPGSAINYGSPTIFSNAFDSSFQIIDISGDGIQNDGANTATARNNALAAGVDRINGLVIGGEISVYNWYVGNVMGGTGAFVTQASNFEAFGAAVESKILAEVPGTIPEPSTLALFGLGLAGFLGMRLRRRKD